MKHDPLKSQHEIARENYEALLMNYAAGVLDQAQNLIVAVHMALSPRARSIVRDCEAIGGALMERECTPATMKSCSLDTILAQLDSRPHAPEPKATPVQLPPEVNIPSHLLAHITCRPCQPQWRAFYPGLRVYELPLEQEPAAKPSSGVRFIKARPAAKMPSHVHRGIEITLVLNGAYSDEMGQYQRGDLVVVDESLEHEVVACRSNGAITMIVSDTPVRFHGLAALLNPFIRF
jgi:putative transcriptional regulator